MHAGEMLYCVHARAHMCVYLCVCVCECVFKGAAVAKITLN
jgi:hypothetical protein